MLKLLPEPAVGIEYCLQAFSLPCNLGIMPSDVIGNAVGDKPVIIRDESLRSTLVIGLILRLAGRAGIERLRQALLLFRATASRKILWMLQIITARHFRVRLLSWTLSAYLVLP